MTPAVSLRLLNWVERTGNQLPHPATLFLLAALLVMVISQIAVTFDWSVSRPATISAPSLALKAQSLLTSEGLWWVLSHLVTNFMAFPPLGLVLVGMLGIGLAERSGLIGALLRRGLVGMPPVLLTPAVLFLGVMSSLALDAGYLVLPPLAAVLFLAAGRSPLVGVAVAFAGVSGGFSANLLITALDPLLAGFTQAGAQLIDPHYQVAVTANWWFMIVSTLLLTGVGWWVTARWVEPHQHQVWQDRQLDSYPAEPTGMVNGKEVRALRAALIAAALGLLLIISLIVIPGAPLYGAGEHFPRWIEASVPLLFFFFLIPSLVFGAYAGSLPSDKDAARMLGEVMASLGPYIVLAFFAAQFIEFFKYSKLGEMLAIAGGQGLAQLNISSLWLILTFVLLVLIANLFIGSASAKYAIFAPVFVPMFMQVGISPELTQAAYRIGDSAGNVIAPLNPYMVIILAFLQRYSPRAGLGTLISLMLPYTLAFVCMWVLLLLVWMSFGIPLGPAGPLFYNP